MKLLLIPALCLLLWACKIHRLPKVKSIQQADSYSWNKVLLDSTTSTCKGDDYFILSQKASSNNLIIYFSGGGAAWDAQSAFNPMGIKAMLKGHKFGYYTDNIPAYIMSMMHGILDKKNEANPFRDWNVVYITYATGDMHAGNTLTTFTKGEKQKTLQFNGQQNTKRALDWTLNNFPQPDKLFICGESAGAFGAAFWTPHIANLYPNSKIYELSDGAFLKSDQWPKIAEQVWKSNWSRNFGYDITENPIKAAFLNDYKALGNKVTFLHTNTLYDEMLTWFNSEMNDLPKNSNSYITKWSNEMLNTTKEIREEVPNYHFYITDYGINKSKATTPHTITRYKLFYEVKENDIRFSQWLSDIIIHNKPGYSVGENFISKMEQKEQ